MASNEPVGLAKATRGYGLPSWKLLKPTRRSRSTISTDQVIATAADVVNREGADALSIRRLAAACELSPMAIHRHVRDKDELLDDVVEHVVGSALPEFTPRGDVGRAGAPAVPD